MSTDLSFNGRTIDESERTRHIAGAFATLCKDFTRLFLINFSLYLSGIATCHPFYKSLFVSSLKNTRSENACFGKIHPLQGIFYLKNFIHN